MCIFSSCMNLAFFFALERRITLTAATVPSSRVALKTEPCPPLPSGSPSFQGPIDLGTTLKLHRTAPRESYAAGRAHCTGCAWGPAHPCPHLHSPMHPGSDHRPDHLGRVGVSTSARMRDQSDSSMVTRLVIRQTLS